MIVSFILMAEINKLNMSRLHSTSALLQFDDRLGTLQKRARGNAAVGRTGRLLFWATFARKIKRTR